MTTLAFVLFLFMSGSFVAESNADESSSESCPKLSVEGQLMEKVLKLELKFEEMGANFRRLEENVIAILQHREENWRTFADGLKRDFTDFKTTHKNLSAKENGTPSVSFSAYSPKKTSLSTGEKIIFQQIFLNHGDAYNNDSGIFVVPVAGTYLLSAHGCNVIGQCAAFGILHDNTEISKTLICDETGHPSCVSANAMVDANVGDQIWVQALYPTYLFENVHRRASFMGFLINPKSIVF